MSQQSETVNFKNDKFLYSKEFWENKLLIESYCNSLIKDFDLKKRVTVCFSETDPPRVRYNGVVTSQAFSDDHWEDYHISLPILNLPKNATKDERMTQFFLRSVFIRHEMAHVLFSDMKELSMISPVHVLSKIMLNALEDVRIEYLMSKKYGGMLNQFNDLAKFFHERTKLNIECLPLNIDMLALYIISRSKNFQFVENDTTKVYEEIYQDNKNFYLCNNLDDLIIFANNIVLALKKRMQENSTENSQQQSGQSQDQSSQEDQKDDKKPAGEKSNKNLFEGKGNSDDSQDEEGDDDYQDGEGPECNRGCQKGTDNKSSGSSGQSGGKNAADQDGEIDGDFETINDLSKKLYSDSLESSFENNQSSDNIIDAESLVEQMLKELDKKQKEKTKAKKEKVKEKINSIDESDIQEISKVFEEQYLDNIVDNQIDFNESFLRSRPIVYYLGEAVYFRKTGAGYSAYSDIVSKNKRIIVDSINYLKNKFQEKKRPRKINNKEEGNLDVYSVSKLFANDHKIFSQTIKHMENNSNVILLVDFSGSMRDAVTGRTPKIVAAMTATIIMHEILKKLNVKHAIYGFSSVYDHRVLVDCLNKSEPAYKKFVANFKSHDEFSSDGYSAALMYEIVSLNESCDKNKDNKHKIVLSSLINVFHGNENVFTARQVGIEMGGTPEVTAVNHIYKTFNHLNNKKLIIINDGLYDTVTIPDKIKETFKEIANKEKDTPEKSINTKLSKSVISGLVRAISFEDEAGKEFKIDCENSLMLDFVCSIVSSFLSDLAQESSCFHGLPTPARKITHGNYDKLNYEDTYVKLNMSIKQINEKTRISFNLLLKNNGFLSKPSVADKQRIRDNLLQRANPRVLSNEYGAKMQAMIERHAVYSALIKKMRNTDWHICGFGIFHAAPVQYLGKNYFQKISDIGDLNENLSKKLRAII